MARPGRQPKSPIEERPAWAQRLTRARDAAGLTQTRLGEMAGIPQQTIGGYETGTAQPDFAQLERLATALGVSPEWIAFPSREGEPTDQDALIGPIIERHKKDEAFVLSLLRTSAMLDEEGFKTDLHFIVRLALRLAQQAKGGADDVSLRERVDAAVQAERLELRRELAAIQQKRL